jgi:hypothetical protein
MSQIGTLRTRRDARLESVMRMRVKADIGGDEHRGMFKDRLFFGQQTGLGHRRALLRVSHGCHALVLLPFGCDHYVYAATWACPTRPHSCCCTSFVKPWRKR